MEASLSKWALIRSLSWEFAQGVPELSFQTQSADSGRQQNAASEGQVHDWKQICPNGPQFDHFRHGLQQGFRNLVFKALSADSLPTAERTEYTEQTGNAQKRAEIDTGTETGNAQTRTETTTGTHTGVNGARFARRAASRLTTKHPKP